MPNVVETAESVLRSLCLEHRCERPRTEVEFREAMRQHGLPRESIRPTVSHPMWDKLYYHEQPKRAREHLSKLAKDYPAEAAIFAPAVDALLAAIAQHEANRKEEKAALEARRAERAKRAAAREELGVDLKAKGGVIATPETYKALCAGLKPIEEGLRKRLKEIHTESYHKMVGALEQADWDLAKTYPYRDRRTGAIVPNKHGEIPDHFYAYFAFNYGMQPGKVVRKPDVTPSAIIAIRAAREAKEAVCGFAAKLAGKVDTELDERGGGTVSSVTCTGDMWTNSVLTVATDKGTQTWHTQIIVNQSCLGKLFNQWPTRRVGLEQSAGRRR